MFRNPTIDIITAEKIDFTSVKVLNCFGLFKTKNPGVRDTIAGSQGHSCYELAVLS